MLRRYFNLSYQHVFIWKNYKYLFYIQIISIIAYAILKLNYESDIVKIYYTVLQHNYFFKSIQ